MGYLAALFMGLFWSPLLLLVVPVVVLVALLMVVGAVDRVRHGP